MFYELREYRILPGQMDNWVNFMQEVIIPFQSGQGMIIVGSFTSTEEDDLYIWMRRFENVEDRVNLYEKVYESQTWKSEIGPKIPSMMDRDRIVVRRISPSSKSIIK